MTSARMIEEGEGARAARARKRRFWWTASLSVLGAFGVGALMTIGKVAPGRISPGWAIATVVAMAVLLPAAIHFNNRATDELDRMDMLRANSFGLYVYAIGQFSWMVLTAARLLPPSDPMVMYVVTVLAALGRYAMLKVAR